MPIAHKPRVLLTFSGKPVRNLKQYLKAETLESRERGRERERDQKYMCSANFLTLEYSRAQILGTVLPTFRLGLPLQLRKPRQCPTDKAMGQSELDHPLSGPLSQGILYCINLTFQTNHHYTTDRSNFHCVFQFRKFV